MEQSLKAKFLLYAGLELHAKDASHTVGMNLLRGELTAFMLQTECEAIQVGDFTFQLTDTINVIPTTPYAMALKKLVANVSGQDIRDISDSDVLEYFAGKEKAA